MKSRVVCMIACMSCALVTQCSKQPYEAPTRPSVTGIALPTLMTACGYSLDGADTLQITAPEQLMCDSAGALVELPEQIVRAWYTAAADSFSISLKDVAPIIRRIMAGPSFTSEVDGFLDILDTMDTGIIVPLGVFLRMEGEAGLAGLWRFAGLRPQFLEDLLPASQSAALHSMITDAEGKASMMFRFEDDTLRGLLSRRTYGDAAIAGVLDTASQQAGVVFDADSNWRVVGGVSGNEAAVMIDGMGNMHWTWGDTDHVYRQFPFECPNPVAPAWLESFLGDTPR